MSSSSPWLDLSQAHTLSERIQADYGLAIPPARIVEQGSLDELAGYIDQLLNGKPQTGVEQSWTFSPENSVFLRDHVVCGHPVFPTDGYIELLAQALRDEPAELVIDQLRLAQPFIVHAGDSKELRLKTSACEHGDRFTFESEATGSTAIHASGVVRRRISGNSSSLEGSAKHWPVLDHAERKIGASEIQRRGNSHFGPFYQCIREIRVRGGDAVSFLKGSVDCHDGYITAPAFLDAAFVTALCLAQMRDTDGVEQTVYLPVLLEGIHIAAHIEAREAFALAEHLKSDANGSIYRVTLIDHDNRILFRCERLHARRMQPHEIATPVNSSNPDTNSIAIIGMSCRFPQADSTSEFWDNIRDGRDCIQDVPPNRWDINRVYDPDPGAPNKTYSRAGGFLNDVDRFDPLFFGISPAEAEVMDPQQRLFLMESWKALEDAGYSEERLSGAKCAVFAGASPGDYMHLLGRQGNTSEAFTGLAASILASRVSYYLNLTGPSISIDTACSSSLVAVRQAITSIESGDCDMALAGGVALLLTPDLHIKACKTGMLSRHGECRSFDASADGIVLGEGVGIVVLKPLAAALQDGDRIYALIRSAGSNQDGRTNGITAPSGAAQRRLLSSVYEKAGIDPRQIGLLEAHGTGTTLGDAVELDSLLSVFPESTTGEAYCSLTSVKSQIGHTTLAAGIASLIKAALSLHHRTLPPSLHFERSLEAAHLERTPFRIESSARLWQSSTTRFAGVSSFGFSGTNCHVLLEEAPQHTALPLIREYEVVGLSAKTSGALRQKITDLLKWAEKHSGDYPLYAAASTAARGRSHFKHRAAFVCSDWEQLIGQLRSEVSAPVTHDAAVQYLSGGETALLDMYPLEHHELIPLPSYPFARKRYWITADEPDRQTPAHHPFTDRTRLPDGMSFTLRFTGKERFFLEHQVAGESVLPGACLIDLALAAASEALGQHVDEMSDIRWLVPVRSGENGAELQVVTKIQDAQSAKFIISHDGAACCTGLARVRKPVAGPTLDTAALRKTATRHLNGSEFYSYVESRSLRLGALFQAIEHLDYGTGYTLSRIVATEPLNSPFLRASLLDAALQTALSSLDEATSGLRLPYSLECLEILASPPATGWACATRDPNHPDASVITLSNDAGAPLMRIRGFVAQSAGRSATLLRAVECWEPLPLASAANPEAVEPLLIFASETSETAKLWQGPAAIVYSGPVFAQVGPTEWRIDACNEEHYRLLLADLAQANLAPRFVLHEWTGRGPDNPARSLFCFVQALLRSSARPSCRIVHRSDGSPGSLAVAGLARTIALETPSIAICVLQHADNHDVLAELLAIDSTNVETRYVMGTREERRLREQVQMPIKPALLHHKGIYVITGGTGSLGLVLARWLHRSCAARLVLLTRTAPRAAAQAAISTLEAAGAVVVVETADLTNARALLNALERARHQLGGGSINGVFHLAGQHRDALIANKSIASFDEILEPKISGLQALDSVLASEPLDFFVLFSSMAAQFGNRGQSDYAVANRFMDAWSEQREEQRKRGERFGITRSINWPLWAGGSMQADVHSAELARTMGFEPLPESVACHAISTALSAEETPLLVLYGDAAKLRRLLRPDTPKAALKPVSAAEHKRRIQELTNIAARILKVDPEELDPTVNLGDYGFHSINITSLANDINRRYGGEITPALLFEYPTLDAIADYLDTTQVKIDAERHDANVEPSSFIQTTSTGRRNETVAVVGMAGRMPQAEDLDAFWANLRDGRHCVTEIPDDRWNWHDYAGTAVDGKNQTDIRWGAFLQQVDRFDPLFFGISPREAACMDPQHRVLLECVWEAIEDSGTAPTSLAGTKTGVFLGISTSDYSELMRDRADGMATHGSTGVAHCMLPNRISYLLDLHGPSEPVDTACSSSLIAIHRATEAIRSGACEMALAGGVNVILSPTLFISFAQAGMLSPDGVCRPFDAAANGYVRGEGAGVVFLKSLSAALRDGNTIHGVIRGGAVNHGGRATSLTAPNPNSQTALLLDAFEDAGINPLHLGYVEAHGTGTPLGDPIELNALRNAFDRWTAGHGGKKTAAKVFAGSVKSNIGHLEAAAGCASFFKVLLAMRHQWIPASLHINNLNPQLSLKDSPFRIAAEGQTWEAPRDDKGQKQPRLAGISAFGFGGANAHLIVEEYCDTNHAEREQSSPQWIVLSARDERRLRLTARRLADALRKPGAPGSLASIAYTLQMGRDEAPERIAFQAANVPEAAAMLASFAEGTPQAGILCGTAGKHKGIAQSVDVKTAGHSWVNGAVVDWTSFYTGAPPRRLSLPGSAFDRQRCWFVEAAHISRPAKSTPAATTEPAFLERVWSATPLGQHHPFTDEVLLIGATPEEQFALQQVFAGTVQNIAPTEAAALLEGGNRNVIYFRPAASDWRTIAQSAAGHAHLACRWVVVQTDNQTDPYFEMVDGLGRAVVSASPRSSFVSLRTDALTPVALATQCEVELAGSRASLVEEVRIHEGQRYRRVTRQLAIDEQKSFSYRKGSAYVITGGLGALGFALARSVAACGARVALLGRSAPSAVQNSLLQELRQNGGAVAYFQADVSDAEQVTAALDRVRAQWGPLRGVIHCAGVLGNSPLARISQSEWDAVLKPKVEGTLALDRATANDPLDFFVLYSSLASVTGDLGHGAYAAANRFLDAFASCRAERGPGQTLSVGWGLWSHGGVCSEADVTTWEQMTGLRALETETALQSLNQLLASGTVHALVVAGDFSSLLAGPAVSLPQPTQAASGSTEAKSDTFLRDEIERQLLERVIAHLQLAPDTLGVHTSLQECGLDSILLKQLVKLLDEEFGHVPKSVLLEHDTVSDIASYLLSQNRCALEARVSKNSDAPAPQRTGLREPIAIVGISGRYPGAQNLEEFWGNLVSGSSAIGELPQARRRDARGSGNRTSRLGAFLDGVELFDPVFFGISAAEARGMKPEERILLELAVEAMENAGQLISSALTNNTGVYIGVTANTYPLLAHDQPDNTAPLDTSVFSLANRISNTLHCEGPSLTLDTGCCSALTSIHMACEALQAGSIRMALAGAVNLILHPSKYDLLENGNLIASEAHPGLFPCNGTGFIPGEGAGVVVLKTLSQATADNDFILGLIAGTAFTHKGGRQKYRVPSPAANKEHLARLFANSQIDPGAVNYVELQALGADLADVTEWSSLASTLGKEAYPCIVGSVKLCIGHLEAASGMAQLTKVLLQLRHGTIPPSPLAPHANPVLREEQSRFVFADNPLPWEPSTGPRLALISSSGVGGTFASLLVTEAPAKSETLRDHFPGGQLLVLSAKSEAQLRRRRADLLSFVESNIHSLSLEDVAFTLQQGREHYRYRWAAVVGDLTELLNESITHWEGRTADRQPPDNPQSLEEMAAAWTQGGSIPAKFHAHGRRVPLPTYPFERIACWVYESTAETPKPLQRSIEAKPADVVATYYNRVTETLESSIGNQDIHLVFAPFHQKVPGFSWLLTFFEPEKRQEHYGKMLAAQREMKRILVRHVDWTKTRRLLDIGCGLATDILHLARKHPSLEAVGFTITPKQAELGQQRIAEAGLAHRLQVLERDSTRDEFPGEFDAALASEVLFHIRDKAALFSNLSRHLRPGGVLVIADCLANTVTNIDHSNVGLFTSNASQMAELLAAHGMDIIACIDCGREMGHFLDDDRFEENLAYVRQRYPEMIQAEPEHRAWHNCGKAFALGLIRYVLLTVRHTPESAKHILQERNLHCLNNPVEYAAGVAELRKIEEPVITDTICKTIGLLDDLRQTVAQVLGVPAARLDHDVPLAEYGVDSLAGLKLLDTLNRRYHLELEMQVLFDCPTIQHLTRAVEQRLSITTDPPAQSGTAAAIVFPREKADEAIAVIGMAGRFPGANNIEQYWDNLKHGVASVTEIPTDRWDASRFYDPDSNQPGRTYSRWGGFVNGVDQFDAGFFRITRAEAEVMDPQQRLFLETCWEALENAGHAGASLRGSACGVIAGVFNNDYQLLLAKNEGARNLGHAMLGNADSVLAARISYFLDLKGPALCLDSACSSSLLAVHVACQSLRAGDADMMLAGGVTLYLNETPFLMMSKAGMLSPTGRCRPFSTDADGITVGEAVGVVVLKRLSDAVRDGDCIHGVIRASGTNQDGQTNGITAPSRDAQKELLRKIYQRYEISPETISYVEAHGTGTKLGDPVEASALCEVFREFTDKEHFCALGSVKGNIGHTSAASGVAGLIKLLLSMRHGMIPPTLHATTANPLLHLDKSPFVLATKALSWTGRQRAAISAFGFSGTNCHVVVDGPGLPKALGPDCESVVTLTAGSEPQLHEAAKRLYVWLRNNESVRVCDVAFTLQTGRTHFAERLQLVSSSARQLSHQLELYLEGEMASGVYPAGSLPPSTPPADVQRVPLPTYPFVRERYWIRDSSAAAGPAKTWNIQVQDEVLVREHILFGRHCMPTDALLDVVYRHAAAHLKSESVQICDTALQAPMFCDPDETVQVSVDHDTTTGQISISSTSRKDEKTRKHLTSWITPESIAQVAKTEAPSDPPETTLNGSSLHGSNCALGVGEYFQSLQTIQIWPGRIIAQLSLSKPARADRARFALHPGLLDGFFGLAHTLAMHAGADQAAAYIPFCIKDVYVFAPLRDTEYRADLRVVKTAEEFLRFDGELINTAGKVVVAIRGLDHRRVASDSLTNARLGNTTMTKLKLRSTSVNSRENKEPADSTLVVKQQTFTSSPTITLSHLRTLLAEVLLCQASSIDVNRSLVEQGVDSILALEFVQRINREFGLRRQGTILFEFPTLAQLAQELETRPDTPPSRQTIPEPNAVLKPPAPELAHQLTNLIAQTLLTDPASINARQSLIEQGVDSILGLEFVQAINRTFSLRLPGTVLFEYPTIENLTSYIAQCIPETEAAPQKSEVRAITPPAVSGDATGDIAIIGMAGRFPGAQTLDELWSHLAANDYLISEVPSDHWDYRPYFNPNGSPGTGANAMYCNRGGFIRGVDQFDPLFFNISPREAETMDPQLRLFLETLWETFEDAGYASRIRGTRTGLYLGNCYNDYLDLMKQEANVDFQFAGSGNSNSMLSNRASFYFDLTGPCLTLDTACSSSLVAVHLAVQALRRGECDMAIAGGVNLNVSPAKYLNFCAIGAFSRSGEIRPFSESADGYLPGEAVAAVLLKPLNQALADGDRVQAVIRGSAVRCAGRSPGPTVPNSRLETSTMIDAWRDARIPPETITYLEAHGTGTKMGDPLEINAIKRAFAESTKRNAFCHLGTIKATLGHTEATAGVAGIIKTVLQMRHRTIAGLPHLLPLNPMIEMENSPLILVPETRPWTPASGERLRAGVSSFGMGGTYAHVVLEEFPDVAPRSRSSVTPCTLILSARTKSAVQESARRLEAFLKQHPDVTLADVAYTLSTGRERMEETISVTASTIAEAVLKLEKASREFPQVPAISEESAPPDGQLIALPSYPFEHQRYWFSTPSQAKPVTVCRLEPDWKTVARHNGFVFRHTARPDDPLVAQHRVDGQSYLPGTAALILAREAAEQLSPGSGWKLSDVVWQTPIKVLNQPVELTLQTESKNDGWAFSLSGEDVHVRGEIKNSEIVEPQAVDLNLWRKETAKSVSATDLYKAIATVGLEYGPYFRNLCSVDFGNDFALGFWEAPPGTAPEAIFDSALQSAGPLFQTQPGAVLPWSVRSVAFHRTIPETGYCLVERRGNMRFAITLCETNGAVCVQLEDFCLRRLAQNTGQTGSYYEAIWNTGPVSGSALSATGPVLIVSQHLEGALTAAVAKYVSGRAVKSLCANESEQGYRDMLARLGPPAEIWFLADAIESAESSVATAADELATGLYRLIRACSPMRDLPLRIRIVTTRAHSILPGEKPLPHGAILHGLTRSIANEFVRWTVTCIDIDEVPCELMGSIASEPALTAGEERAYRGAKRWVRRLQPAAVGEHCQLPIRKRGVYLITGGAQGLGFETARWLARDFQAQLILLGRRPLAGAIWDSISTIERLGGEALYVRADLSERAALERALRLSREHFGPIEGVIHSAMVLHDGLLQTIDEKMFRAVLAPKVQGLENLRELLRADPLTFALLFSSLQSQLGNPGQASYAAASTFADSFAAAWRAESTYPIKVVNWSYWGTVGAVATEDYRRRMQAAGVISTEPDEGKQIIQSILSSRTPEQLWSIKGELRFLRLLGLAPEEDSDFDAYPEQTPSLLKRSLSMLREAV